MGRTKDTSAGYGMAGIYLLLLLAFLYFGPIFLYSILFVVAIYVLKIASQKYLKITREKQVQIGYAVQRVHQIDQKRLNICNSWIEAEKQRGDYVRDALSYYNSVDIQPGTYLNYKTQSNLMRNQIAEAEQVFHRLQILYEHEQQKYQNEIKIQENLAYIRHIEEIREGIQKTWIRLEKQRIGTGSPRSSAYYSTVTVLPGTYSHYCPSAETKNGQIWETEQIIVQLQTLYECEHMHKEKEYNERKRSSKVSGTYGGGPYYPYDYNYLKDLYGL